MNAGYLAEPLSERTHFGFGVEQYGERRTVIAFAGQRRLESHGTDRIAILGSVFLLPEGSSIADQSTLAENRTQLRMIDSNEERVSFKMRRSGRMFCCNRTGLSSPTKCWSPLPAF
jgi:hypothetical protein